MFNVVLVVCSKIGMDASDDDDDDDDDDDMLQFLPHEAHTRLD